MRKVLYPPFYLPSVELYYKVYNGNRNEQARNSRGSQHWSGDADAVVAVAEATVAVCRLKTHQNN
jgi:hypothetical protein